MALIAIFWSLFQLLTANLVLVDSLTMRAIHLSFALLLSYKNKTVFGLLAALSALYLALNFDAISSRQGAPSSLDITIGIFLLSFLLYAVMKEVGKAIGIITICFMLSSLFASDLPSIFASKDVSISHLVSKLTLSLEGIYGIPLRISADTIFLFVLFGAFLEKSGGGKYFVDLALCLVGRYQAGPAKASVLASGLTGMISGSSIANAVTTGTFTIPLMKKAGYPAEKAAAIEAAASTNGQLMPPIMGASAFIIAEYCQIDYIEVVKAAFIPAMLSYLALIYITHLEAKKLGIKKSLHPLPKFRKLFFEGIHFFIPVLFLLYQLIINRYSPSYSAYSAIIALIVVLFIWDAIEKAPLKSTWNTITESLQLGAQNMVAIALAVATAGCIVGVVTLGLGGKITEVIDLLSGGYFFSILIVSAIVSLILGMGLPTTATYIVMANLTAPAISYLAEGAGFFVPLIAAHLFCFYFGILADDTPPVGLAAYATSAIAKSDPVTTSFQSFFYDLRTAILPFMFIFNPKLLLIGVTTITEGLWIFFTGLIALFAFSAATLGYFLRKNRIIEFVLLLLSTLFLMQPQITSSEIISYFVGLALYTTVLCSQLIKKQ